MWNFKWFCFHSSRCAKCNKKATVINGSWPWWTLLYASQKGGIFLASKLAVLFNLSLSSARIPNSWRNIVITPVYKSGSRESFLNYRPIACRVMVRVMMCVVCLNSLLAIIFFFISAWFLTSARSVEMAGIVFYNFLHKNLDLGNCVDACFYTLTKHSRKFLNEFCWFWISWWYHHLLFSS